MASYEINKGVGKPVEFKGLKAQYIFYLGGGLMGAFILFVVMYIAGVSMIFSLPFSLLLVSLLFHFVFSVSKKYGQHGLMKLMARSRRPKYLINLGYSKSAFFNSPKSSVTPLKR